MTILEGKVYRINVVDGLNDVWSIGTEVLVKSIDEDGTAYVHKVGGSYCRWIYLSSLGEATYSYKLRAMP